MKISREKIHPETLIERLQLIFWIKRKSPVIIYPKINFQDKLAQMKLLIMPFILVMILFRELESLELKIGILSC
jgi:hypothetical protein